MGDFPDPKSSHPECKISFENARFYYSCLKEYGFENAHLTDIIKCQKPVKAEVTPLELRSCVTRFLSKEIEIVKPDLIVTLGRRASDLMSCIQAWLKTNIPHFNFHIMHNGNRRKKVIEFRKALKRLRDLIKSK